MCVRAMKTIYMRGNVNMVCVCVSSVNIVRKNRWKKPQPQAFLMHTVNICARDVESSNKSPRCIGECWALLSSNLNPFACVSPCVYVLDSCFCFCFCWMCHTIILFQFVFNPDSWVNIDRATLTTTNKQKSNNKIYRHTHTHAQREKMYNLQRKEQDREQNTSVSQQTNKLLNGMVRR